MSEMQNADVIRSAYAAFGRGDFEALLAIVDPNLEWTFLDPSEPDPEPRVCHGRHELAERLQRQLSRGLRPELEEVQNA